MKLNIGIASAILLSSLTSLAGVHVGNAGGEAEMTVLRMAPAAAVWAKACNENRGLCGNANAFTASDARSLSQVIAFAPASHNLEVCAANQVTLAHEDLYVEGEKPKSEIELAQIMIQQMLSCGGWKMNRLHQLKFDRLLPVAKKFVDLPFAAVAGRDSDIIVALESSQNAHFLLTQLIGCKALRAGGGETNGIRVLCLDDKKSYLVMIRNEDHGFRFVAKSDSGEY